MDFYSKDKNDIFFWEKDTIISRFQCQIYYIESEQQSYLMDKGSNQGTIIKIKQHPVVLQKGIVIELADCSRLVVEECKISLDLNPQQLNYAPQFVKVLNTTTCLNNYAMQNNENIDHINLKKVQHGSDYVYSKKPKGQKFSNLREMGQSFQTIQVQQQMLQSISEQPESNQNFDDNQVTQINVEVISNFNELIATVNQAEQIYQSEVNENSLIETQSQVQQNAPQVPASNLQLLEKDVVEQAHIPFLEFKVYQFFKQTNTWELYNEEVIEITNMQNIPLFEIGRHENSNLYIKDKDNAISGKHAWIEYNKNFGWLLYDGGKIQQQEQNLRKFSGNGTFVQLNDYQRLLQRKKSLGYMLKKGTVFNICGYWFTVDKKV